MGVRVYDDDCAAESVGRGGDTTDGGNRETLTT